MGEHSEGKLFESLRKVMLDHQNSLAMVRASTRVILNVVTQLDVAVDWVDVNAMLGCLEAWTTSTEQDFSYDQPLTKSKDIQKIIADTLAVLVDRMPASDATEEVINSVANMKGALGQVDPEAQENLNKFLEHISPTEVAEN